MHSEKLHLDMGKLGKTAALVMRLTQALFDTRRVKLHCFVDDPIASIRGSLGEAIGHSSYDAVLGGVELQIGLP